MKLGFIGCGNMASAMIGGIIRNHIVKPEEIIGSGTNQEKLESIEKKLGIITTLDNKEVAEKSDIIFLSVKPQFYETVIQEIKDCVTQNQILVTVAPGKTLAWLEGQFGGKQKIVRTMPNTPALVGEGITGVCSNELVTEEEQKLVCTILNGFGKVGIVSEKLLDVVGAVSGSSPAFIFLMIEAMADGAVLEGMPRKEAYQFAALAVLGSAKMVLETGKHPGELKDMVCSPGGTTIEGISMLEERGFRSAVMESIRACVKKTKEI